MQIIFSRFPAFFRQFFQDRSLPRILDAVFLFFFAVLPFHVLLSVFAEYRLGIPGFSLYKELVLMVLAGTVGYAWHRKLLRPFDRLDALIAAYVAVLVIVTFANGLPIRNVVYGGRYDFEFLLAFFLARKAAPLLEQPFSRYLRTFVYSASAALVLGILVRFVFGEQVLLHFGFSANLSNWMFGGSIPIYHGIDGANVRRFQGIFDGPNPAGYFIIVYLWALAYYMREKKPYHFLLSIWGLVLLGVTFYTYSRSAILGLCVAVACFVLFSARKIWQKHRKAVLAAIPVIMLIAGAFYVKFEGTFENILVREGSTKGHFDRVVIGLKRFTAHPAWSGLATSGPAYRYVTNSLEHDEGLFDGENKTQEDYYIPESWYVQQLVEGGIVGFALFVAIMGLVFLALAGKNVFIAASFSGVLVMNLFLHSFESSYISLLLFLLIGLILGYERKKRSST